MDHRNIKSIGAAAAAIALIGLAGCAGQTRVGMGNAAMRAGQESTFHTPQGETGTPHGHGNGAAVSSGGGQATMGAGGSVGGRVTSGAPVGQESGNHTPQGETGTPHTH